MSDYCTQNYVKIPVESPIQSMVCTSDSKNMIIGHLATSRDTPTLSIMDIESGELEKIIEKSVDQNNSVLKVVIDNTDTFLVYVKQVYDGENKLQYTCYNVQTEEKNLLFETLGTEPINEGFNISPDNFFVVGFDNRIEFWNLENKIKEKEIILEEQCVINDNHCYTSLTFSSNSQYMAVGGLEKGTILLYDMKHSSVVKKLSANYSFPCNIYFDLFNEYIAVLDYWNHGLFIWDLENFERHEDWYYDEENEQVTSLSFLPNTTFYAYGMLTSIVGVMDLKKVDDIYEDEMHEARVQNVLFTPDGKKLISAGEDWKIVVRDVNDSYY